MTINRDCVNYYLTIIIFLDIIGYGYYPAIESPLTQILKMTITATSLLSCMALIILNFSKVLNSLRSLPKAFFFINSILVIFSLFSMILNENSSKDTITILIRLVFVFITFYFLAHTSILNKAIYTSGAIFTIVTLLLLVLMPSLALEQSIRLGALKGLLVYKTQFAIASLFFLCFFLFLHLSPSFLHPFFHGPRFFTP